MLTSTLLVLGLVYVGRLPVDLLPRIVYPQVRVSVSNAGVEPVVLEETVAKVLESSLATTQNLERMETDISEGRVSISARLPLRHQRRLRAAGRGQERGAGARPGSPTRPTRRSSASRTRRRCRSSRWPSPPTERDLVALRQWVDQRLRPQLLSVDGVASVDVSGGLVREVQVELDPERLRGFGLTVNGVLSALRNDNQNIAGGRVSGPDLELVSRTTGKFENVDDIRGVLLTGAGGTRVPLRDVATDARHQPGAALLGAPERRRRRCASASRSSPRPTPSRWWTA